MLPIMEKPRSRALRPVQADRHPCCERCQGSGWVRMRLLEHREAIGITCPVCRGDGRVPAAAGWRPPPRFG